VADKALHIQGILASMALGMRQHLADHGRHAFVEIQYRARGGQLWLVHREGRLVGAGGPMKGGVQQGHEDLPAQARARLRQRLGDPSPDEVADLDQRWYPRKDGLEQAPLKSLEELRGALVHRRARQEEVHQEDRAREALFGDGEDQPHALLEAGRVGARRAALPGISPKLSLSRAG
jgi:hypothetical protein